LISSSSNGYVLLVDALRSYRADGQVPNVAVPVLQNDAGARNTVLAVYLRDHVGGHPLVAVFWAGTLPYFTDWSAVDLLRKTDRQVAHLAPGAPGHNKWDYKHSLGMYEPDFVVSFTVTIRPPESGDAPSSVDLGPEHHADV
jgi:hypothetical protein